MKVQHRLLSEGEEIKEGDEIYHANYNLWIAFSTQMLGTHWRSNMKLVRGVMEKPTRRSNPTLKQEAKQRAEELGITVRKSWTFHKIIEEINKVVRDAK